MISLVSLSFNFDAVEDRIRMIGNLRDDLQRYDLWLTRRLVLRILEASPQLVRKTSVKVSQAPIEHQAALAQFEHDQAKLAPVDRETIKDHLGYDAALLHRIDISFQEGRFHLIFYRCYRDTLCFECPYLSRDASSFVLDA